MTRIVFLCTGNRARSQLAEGLARAMAAPGVEVASAGTKPNPKGVHATAIALLHEKGVDATAHHAKHIDSLSGEFDFVITLCDTAAQECPSFPARRARLHWSTRDPGEAEGDAARELALFREVCAELEGRIREWMRQEGLLRKP